MQAENNIVSYCNNHIYWVRIDCGGKIYFYYDYLNVFFSITIDKDIKISFLSTNHIIHLPRTETFNVTDLNNYLNKILEMRAFL